jgi:hypothetical protein
MPWPLPRGVTNANPLVNRRCTALTRYLLFGPIKPANGSESGSPWAAGGGGRCDGGCGGEDSCSGEEVNDTSHGGGCQFPFGKLESQVGRLGTREPSRQTPPTMVQTPHRWDRWGRWLRTWAESRQDAFDGLMQGTQARRLFRHKSGLLPHQPPTEVGRAGFQALTEGVGLVTHRLH